MNRVDVFRALQAELERHASEIEQVLNSAEKWEIILPIGGTVDYPTADDDPIELDFRLVVRNSRVAAQRIKTALDKGQI